MIRLSQRLRAYVEYCVQGSRRWRSCHNSHIYVKVLGVDGSARHTAPILPLHPRLSLPFIVCFFHVRQTVRWYSLLCKQRRTVQTHTLQNPPSGSSRLLRGGCEYLAKCAGLVW